MESLKVNSGRENDKIIEELSLILIAMKTAAYIIIVIGLILTVVTAVTFFTKEKIVDTGNIEISRNKPTQVSWSPLIGIGVIAVGGILLFASKKK